MIKPSCSLILLMLMFSFNHVNASEATSIQKFGVNFDEG